ncbi:MAG: cupin domain-containing protein [Firmicutes bacterium]|nr:cupin domain-containing protein [Bacillota bacterium]
MNNILHAKIEEIPKEHNNKHEGYEYYRRRFTPLGFAEQCEVSIYEIPPGNAMCPYHYHVMNEETFYIISGKGLLKTPTGEKEVLPGDILFFPANENGAHKLTNISDTEMLVYLDFGTRNEIEVAFYPNSGKIGVWGKNINKIYKENQNVDYYNGE